jgi:hypothetical protein
MPSLYSPPVALTLDRVESQGLEIGQQLFVILLGDDVKQADRIRNDYALIASGLCETKGKRISVHQAPDGKLFGVSEARPGWHFRVKRAVLEKEVRGC